MALPYFFSIINPEIVVMGVFFLIFLAFISYGLSKVFRDRNGNVNKITVGVISIGVSFLIIYFGRNTFYQLIGNLRISDTLLYILSIAAVLILLYLFRKKLRICWIIALIGIGLILIVSLTDWVYQEVLVFIIGLVLLIWGGWMCSKEKIPKLKVKLR